MKKILFTLLFFVLTFQISFSCGNFYYTLDREGNFHEADDILEPFNKNFKLPLNVQKMKLLLAKLKKEKSYMLLSDYSLCLLKLGKTNEAVAMLAELEKHYPGEYKIASNLGTAYELSGQNDSALKYINLGLKLNPLDHEGSEWIHAKILETKIAMSKSPDYLKTHSVLSLTETQKHDSAVRAQLTLQLRERFPFTPAPNPLMAQLLIELGDCCANTSSIEYAKAIYQIAKNYYGANSPELDAKINEMQKLVNKYLNKQPATTGEEHGAVMKMGVLKYTQLIQDNQIQNYKIDWSKIIANPDSLLAMVDLTLTVPEAIQLSEKNPNDSLKFKHDISISASDEKHTEKQNDFSWIKYFSIGAISMTLFLILRKYILRKQQK
ncbi:MAG TPA: hypothetical protein DCQ93_07835 [Bacteroidetes bacterium]|nr:hypothetical protein [Bacteroidota bacterium]